MDDLEKFDTIASCTFYGKKKGRLPPPPQVSDGSDDSDDEEIYGLGVKTINQNLGRY